MAEFQRYTEIQNACLKSLLRPVIRFCIRRSQSFPNFLTLAKELFVELAEEEIRKSTEKVNVSRLSLITGLPRREVTSIYRDKKSPGDKTQDLLTRVINQWDVDPQFHNKAGAPRVLSENEFRKLVSSVSKNINPGTVIFELERIGLIKRSAKGIRLIKQEFRVYDTRQGFELLSRDIETLVWSVEENLIEPQEITNLHIRTEYDNVYQKDIPKIRLWLVNEGKAFHKRAREFISAFDKDITPNRDVKEKAGAKVVLGAFSITEKK